MFHLKFFRPYRMLTVGLTVAPILLRYGWLLTFRKNVSDADWASAHAFAAHRIERMALKLGGVFIKLAQVLGARRDVFPEPFIRVLSKFHDQVPARPLAELRRVIEADLCQPLPQVFAKIEEQPLGAASLAQVHKAWLHDGRMVAVKVQYPEAARLFPTDIKTARVVARVVQRFPIHIDFVAVVDEIAKFVALELDFVREVAAMQRVAASFADSADVVVPQPLPQCCGKHVITMTFIEGIQVTQVEALKAAGHDLIQVAERIARVFARMIFRQGFFNGDPHPGNLLVMRDGRLGLLDFGLSKELPAGFALGVAKFLLGVFAGDLMGAQRAAEGIGFQFGSVKPEALKQVVFKLMGQASQGGLLDLLADSPIKTIPPDFPLIARALILLNGISHALAPGQRIIQRALLAELVPLVTQAQTNDLARAQAA